MYKEKLAFKELVRSGIRRNEELVPKFEENFDEAIKNVNNSIVPTKIPTEIKSLFEDEKCLNLNSSVSKRLYRQTVVHKDTKFLRLKHKHKKTQQFCVVMLQIRHFILIKLITINYYVQI